MILDGTLFEDDDVTPFFGVGDEYGLDVADFSTDPAHPRPHLFEVKNWRATEIDFPAGAATLGGVTVEILDVQTGDSQEVRLLTARLSELVGKRFLLRRQHPTLGMVTAFNALVKNQSLGSSPEGLVKITLQLVDIRERQRRQPIFLPNFVLFGKDGARGPADDYGATPVPMLQGVDPALSEDYGGIDHFERQAAPDDNGIYWGVLSSSADAAVSDFGITDQGWPTSDPDGLFYYRDFYVKWRAAGSSDPWKTLTSMPRSAYQHAATGQSLAIGSGLGDVQDVFKSGPTLYLGSFDEADIPTDGQHIEYRVFAADITEDAPFHLDGQTFGELLKDIYDGVQSVEDPRVSYNPDAMAAFAESTPEARVFLTEQPENMLEWVQENIYAPLGYAPTFDEQGREVPVSWRLPKNTDSIPRISASSIIGISGWEHGADSVINRVEFTHVREHLEPLRTIQEKKGHLWWKKTVDVVDPTDDRAPWERVVRDEVHNDHVDVASVATYGPKKIVYKPVTVRANGKVDGSPIGGDAQNELGAQLSKELAQLVFSRAPNGMPRLTIKALASDLIVANAKAGDWFRVKAPAMPDYSTGIREGWLFMQAISISDEDPTVRAMVLVYSGVPDLSNEETGEGTGGEDCLTGGVLVPGAGGTAVRAFIESGYLTNVCDHPVTIDDAAGVAGGGGGGFHIGGGGGAGGVVKEKTFTLAPGQSIYVQIGDGGIENTSGEDTIVWIHKDTGATLDPDTDDPGDAIIFAHGGGGGGSNGGGGDTGGSGGGGGAQLPGSGGGSHTGGAEETGQGNSGGSGNDAGGIATCRGGAGGGGGSYAGAGQDGVTSPNPIGGAGGPGSTLPGWGFRLGGGGHGAAAKLAGASGEEVCGEDFEAVGRAADKGFGAGGYGGVGIIEGGTGTSGVAAFRYTGPTGIALSSPEITSATTSSQNQNTVCVEGEQWPLEAELVGFRVRVEYAVNATEPAATSGLWRLAGYLEAPGCVTTPPVPTGATVWHRAIAEAPGFLPSAPGDATNEVTPETPGLLTFSLTVDPLTGIATVRWTANAFADALRIRGKIHAQGESTDRPLDALDDVDAADGEYILADPVPQGSYVTVDLEAWEDDTYTVQGRTYRLSVQNPVHEIATPEESIGFFSDVELSDPADDALQGEILVRDEYDVFRNRTWPRLDEWTEPEDNTDLDASAARHGLLRKLSGNAGEFLRGDGAWAAVQQEWTEIIATVDQDVVNNTTLQNDSELSFPVVAGAVYNVELLLLYSGSDNTPAFKYDFSYPTSEIVYDARARWNAGHGLQNLTTATAGPSTNIGTEIELGTSVTGFSLVRYARFTGELLVGASGGTFQFRFANQTGGVGKTSRRWAGSILRYRRLV